MPFDYKPGGNGDVNVKSIDRPMTPSWVANIRYSVKLIHVIRIIVEDINIEFTHT